MKKKKLLKVVLLSIVSAILFIVSFGFWFMSLLPASESRIDLKQTLSEQLAYLEHRLPARGKILAVVTSIDSMGKSGKSTGYELTELARPYYVFKANGFEVEIASTMGGNPPVGIDADDMGAFDYAFLNDKEAQNKVENSLRIDSVRSEEYVAIFFVGGKGAMYDFPNNAKIKSLVSDYYQNGKVIGAVCHGPAALVNARLENGAYLLYGKEISGFTNREELFLIPDAKEVFPFLLEDKLVEQGAKFNEGYLYLENFSHDKNLITGQNPWSSWSVAEAMVTQLGYTPVQRQKTAEELTIDVLKKYESNGYEMANLSLKDSYKKPSQSPDRLLLAMHCVVSLMQGNMVKTVNLIRLLSTAKRLSNTHRK
jgi:putative intracellular protease/amidase